MQDCYDAQWVMPLYLPSFWLGPLSSVHAQHILGFLVGGSTLRDMAAAFAAVPASVLWKLTDKERAEIAEPGFPALNANVKARACAGHKVLWL